MASAVKVPEPSLLAPWGSAPKGATRWQCHRQDGGRWEACQWYESGANVARRVWPLSDLSVQTIGARWGAGRYRLTWQGDAAHARDGKRPPSLGTSSIFQVDGFPVKAVYPNAPNPDALVPSPAPAPVVAAVDSPAALFEMIWRTTETHHASVLAAQASVSERAMQWLATAYGSEADRSRQHQAAMLALAKQGHSREVGDLTAQIAALASQVRDLARRLDEEEEEEEETPATGKDGEKDVLTRLQDVGMEALERFGPDAVQSLLEKLNVVKKRNDDD